MTGLFFFTITTYAENSGPLGFYAFGKVWRRENDKNLSKNFRTARLPEFSIVRHSA
jgi:hypothetical protein